MPPEKPENRSYDLPNPESPPYRQMEGVLAEALRCLRCDAPVPNLACGRKTPSPSCGFPYPLGDCSDLAEN